MEMTSTECLWRALFSLLDFSLARFLLCVLGVPEPRLVRPVLCLRKEAHAIPSCTTPACQMKAANTARILSATLGLIASTTGPAGT